MNFIAKHLSVAKHYSIQGLFKYWSWWQHPLKDNGAHFIKHRIKR